MHAPWIRSLAAASVVAALAPGGVHAQNAGRWSGVINLPIIPVAAANLPDGKLLVWSAYDRINFGGDRGQTYTAIFDPATSQSTERLVTETAHDMFCPGTANLADGRILVNGGSSSAKTSLYDPFNNSWSSAQLMNIPRGYHANTPLPNGEVFTIGGSWSGGQGNKDGEVWNAASGWRRLPGVLDDPIVAPDPQGIYRGDNHAWLFSFAGQVFHAGPSQQMNWFGTSGSGSSTSAGNRGDDVYAMNGNAVMYDVGKILKVGGAPAYQNTNATNSAHVIDINGAVSTRRVASMAFARAYHSSVVLPNGQVVVTGGQAFPIPFNDASPVLDAELWNPATETFRTLAPMSVPRTYHSVALLLIDGRVFVGGGGLCGTCSVNHPNAQIFTPPYLLNADGSAAARPSITAAPASAAHGSSIGVSTGAPVSAFALMRLSSITHTVNNDQRRVPLTFSSAGTNSYALNIPVSTGVVLPGYYMLFALNSAGVPSVAKVLRIAQGAGGAIDPARAYDIVNRNSNKCVDINAASTADNATVIQWTCHGGANQKFKFVPTSGGFYRIVAQHSGKVLRVTGGSTADGANIIQTTWASFNSQQWRPVPVAGGFYKFVNRNSNKVMEVPACSTTNGTQLQQRTDANNACQAFRLQ